MNVEHPEEIPAVRIENKLHARLHIRGREQPIRPIYPPGSDVGGNLKLIGFVGQQVGGA